MNLRTSLTSHKCITTTNKHFVTTSFIWIIWLKYLVSMFIKTFNHPSPFDPSPIPPLYQVTLIILDPAFTGTSVPLDSTVGQRFAKPDPRTCRWMDGTGSVKLGRFKVEDVTCLVRFVGWILVRNFGWLRISWRDAIYIQYMLCCFVFGDCQELRVH